MISFENGVLTIDTSLSRADSQAISAFADTVRNGEQERIIKLLEKMPWQVYSGVGIDGKPIESVCTPKVLIREDVIALIKGEK